MVSLIALRRVVTGDVGFALAAGFAVAYLQSSCHRATPASLDVDDTNSQRAHMFGRGSSVSPTPLVWSGVIAARTLV